MVTWTKSYLTRKGKKNHCCGDHYPLAIGSAGWQKQCLWYLKGNWNKKKNYWLSQKSWKEKFWVKKRRVQFWLYWQRDTMSVRLLPSLKFIRRQFIRTRSSSRHWGQQSYRPAECENNILLTGMTVNSFECHSATVGWPPVTYRKNGKWQLSWSARQERIKS